MAAGCRAERVDAGVWCGVRSSAPNAPPSAFKPVVSAMHMFWQRALVIAMVATGLLCVSQRLATTKAEDAPTVAQSPRSAAAAAALAKRDKSIEAARVAYWNAVAAASKAATPELEAALKVAMKASDLDEANRIKASIEQVKADQAAALGQVRSKGLPDPRSVTVRVPANVEWTKVGTVRRGEVLLIEADGRWSIKKGDAAATTGPDGITWEGHAQLGMLLGRVNKTTFPVGVKTKYVVPEDGDLLLGAKDTQHSDNEGALEVTISKSKS